MPSTIGYCHLIEFYCVKCAYFLHSITLIPYHSNWSCSDESVLKQIFQSHPRELHFNSVKELIKYYRSGDCSYLKLTNQLSPVPRGELLNVCLWLLLYNLHFALIFAMISFILKADMTYLLSRQLLACMSETI